MRFSVAIIAVAVSAVLGAAGVASAQTAPADGPVSTAPASGGGGAPLSTQQQIDRYLASSPAVLPPTDGVLDAPGAEAERRIHGEVSVSVGTGGYRSGSAVAVIPLGESGTLGLAFRHTDFGDSGYGYGYGGGPGYGYGYDSLATPLDAPRLGEATTDCEARFRERGRSIESGWITPSLGSAGRCANR